MAVIIWAATLGTQEANGTAYVPCEFTERHHCWWSRISMRGYPHVGKEIKITAIPLWE